MPSIYGGLPSTWEMVQAVVYFTVLTTPITVLLWYGIRRRRQSPMRWGWAWLGSALICAIVSGIDVSCGTTSGIFSIFAAIVIPVYIVVVLLVASVAALFVR